MIGAHKCKQCEKVLIEIETEPPLKVTYRGALYCEECYMEEKE